jgi:hypothetical protein
VAQAIPVPFGVDILADSSNTANGGTINTPGGVTENTARIQSSAAEGKIRIPFSLVHAKKIHNK